MITKILAGITLILGLSLIGGLFYLDNLSGKLDKQKIENANLVIANAGNLTSIDNLTGQREQDQLKIDAYVKRLNEVKNARRKFDQEMEALKNENKTLNDFLNTPLPSELRDLLQSRYGAARQNNTPDNKK